MRPTRMGWSSQSEADLPSRKPSGTAAVCPERSCSECAYEVGQSAFAILRALIGPDDARAQARLVRGKFGAGHQLKLIAPPQAGLGLHFV